MKIGGASLEEDIERIKAVLEVTGGAGESLAVDANGRFDLDTAISYGKALAPFNLRWYEEAGDPLDYHLQAELSKVYPAELAMATGENLFSMQDARNLVRYGGMHPETDILQVIDCNAHTYAQADRDRDRDRDRQRQTETETNRDKGEGRGGGESI
eukprot:SAG31_NODE_4626_length_3087_cov_4.080991_3_plen_156_part_00